MNFSVKGSSKPSNPVKRRNKNKKSRNNFAGVAVLSDPAGVRAVGLSDPYRRNPRT
jgi:hypothetical protein